MNPKLVVQQKITVFANKYLIYQANPDGGKGELLAFAQQKRLAFREKVTFYADEAKTQAVFSFRAEKVVDIHGRYFVEDANGQQVGSFKKEFARSLINSTWTIFDTNNQPAMQVVESNHALAIMRRFGGLVPIVGAFSEIVTALLRYHFDITDLASNQVVGKYQKTKLIRDHYLLSMGESAYEKVDWRVLASLSVALDALQSR